MTTLPMPALRSSEPGGASKRKGSTTVKLTGWPLAAVIMAFLAAFVIMSVFSDKDTGTLVAIGMAILAGVGVSVGAAMGIKDQVNGNTTRMMDIIEQLAHRLGDAPATPRPSEEGKDPDSTL